MSDDIKTFARKHAPKMGENVISLFKRILEKHDAALLEVVCEQQNRIQELEAALAKREAVAEAITAEMYIVGGETFFDCAKQYGISGSTEEDQDAAARIYRAMLAASQQAAKGEGSNG